MTNVDCGDSYDRVVDALRGADRQWKAIQQIIYRDELRRDLFADARQRAGARNMQPGLVERSIEELHDLPMQWLCIARAIEDAGADWLRDVIHSRIANVASSREPADGKWPVFEADRWEAIGRGDEYWQMLGEVKD